MSSIRVTRNGDESVKMKDASEADPSGKKSMNATLRLSKSRASGKRKRDLL
jgi:hypothetical protein